MRYSKITIIFIFISVLILPLNSCYAHTVDSNDTQMWNDAKENLKIEFGYTPEKPIIDTSKLCILYYYNDIYFVDFRPVR
jgi:hypothetical protein